MPSVKQDLLAALTGELAPSAGSVELFGTRVPQDRRALLAYEATEGGAGVLSRLIEQPEALARAAHAA